MELGKRQPFWIGDYSGGSRAALLAAAHADWPRKGLDRDPGALKKINTGARSNWKKGFPYFRPCPRTSWNKLREASPSKSMASTSASESAILGHVDDSSA